MISLLKVIRRILWMVWLVWMVLKILSTVSPEVALFIYGLGVSGTGGDFLTVLLPLAAIVVGVLELLVRKLSQRAKA